MKDTPFQFEVENVMSQFMAAMDDIIINRYNNNREVQDRILVRMLYSPKERVLLDLVDKAQTIQLPVISISIASIARDPSRVFNKIAGSNYATPQPSRTKPRLPQPIPVNITVNFSILARYQKDIDQILSNFIPYFDPYIIISWRIPDMQDQEIRSTVEWSGVATQSYPLAQNVPSSTIARNVVDTSFTIKGWLFKEIPSIDNGDPLIFTITTNFYALCSTDDFGTVPKDSLYWESVTLSAIRVIPIIITDSLSAASLSAGNMRVTNDIKIDDSLWADFGYFDTLSGIEINAHLFTGDGSGIINVIPKSQTLVIGDGISNNYIINHNFGTYNTITQVYDTLNENNVYPSIQNVDINFTEVSFKNPPSVSAYKVVIVPAN